MATVYSLICWGGRLGKAVTASSATDLVTLTNHGLRDGTGVAFTGGTLPTVSGAALGLNTIYFAKSTAASTFELYYDDALTSKIDFTSTGSSLIMKSAYFLWLADLSRWGSSGSERIYDGLVAWRTARFSAATEYDAEICELGQAFTDIGVSLTLDFRSSKTLITSRVNGVRSEAWHAGNVTAGYEYKGSSPVLNIFNYSATDGFRVTTGSSSAVFMQMNAFSSAAANMIAAHNSTAGGIGVNMISAGQITNSVVYGMKTGMSFGSGVSQCLVANCITTKCAEGMFMSSTRQGRYYNNISVGNTLNWSNLQSAIERADRNFGASGDTPWAVGGGTTGTMTTADFADWANNDFRPASSSSPQVEGGVAYYGVTPTDIRDAVTPNYKNGAPAYIDAGCYEFDHGFGPWPASHTLTLQNVVVGSRILIRDQADTTTHYSADAASSTVVIPITLFGDARDQWTIKVRKGSASPFYQPWRTQMTATPGESSIYVEQIPDE